jgi:hypothetical protein
MLKFREGRISTSLSDESDWLDLISGTTDAIAVQLASPEECEQLVKFITCHPELSSYSTAVGISKLGTSFSDVRRRAAGEGISIVDALRAPYSDFASEISTVNTVMERILGRLLVTWRPGIEALRIEDYVLARLIARRIVDGNGAEPHDDDIAKEFGADSSMAAEVLVQLGFNLYIELPSEGGALEGWRRRFSREEYERHRNRGRGLDYGVERDVLGNSDWKVVPQLGEAVVFRNSDLHAIAASKGSRTTLGFFLGYRSVGRSLLIWS